MFDRDSSQPLGEQAWFPPASLSATPALNPHLFSRSSRSHNCRCGCTWLPGSELNAENHTKQLATAQRISASGLVRFAAVSSHFLPIMRKIMFKFWRKILCFRGIMLSQKHKNIIDFCASDQFFFFFAWWKSVLKYPVRFWGLPALFRRRNSAPFKNLRTFVG